MTNRNFINNNQKRLIKTMTIAILFGLTLNACNSTPTPDPEILVRKAVNATLAAIPTVTPIATPTQASTSTPVSINNLFCEYNFCIGHPQDIYLIDQGSTRQPPIASTYATGIVFGYSSSFFMQVNWTVSGPTYDPQTSMHGILTGSESFQGTQDKLTVGNITASTQPISTVTSLLPYGLAAAWQCGDRDFAWKVYTPVDGTATDLLKQALASFKCQGY